jgi:hypothetical protein
MSFSGTSFTFGDLTISDSKKLVQYSNDHLMHQISFLLSKRKKIGFKPIFEDSQFKPSLDRIHELNSTTLDCVKSKGWVYINKKKEK